jgi:PKD repeat protein
MVKFNQNGCADSAAVGTLVMSGFTLDPQLAVDSSACPTLSFSAQDPNSTTWDWTFGDGGSALAAPGSIQHTYSAGGVYTVIVADSNGCGLSADTLMVTVTCLPAAIGPGGGATVTAFPNPFSNEIKLHFDALPVGDVSYSVVDLQGRRVAEGTLPTSNGQTEHVVLAPVVAGSYVLELRDGAGVSRIRLVKE